LPPTTPNQKGATSPLWTPHRRGDSPRTPTRRGDPPPLDPSRLEVLRPPGPPDQGKPWTHLTENLPMGFAVLHYDKQTGSSPGLSQHIERGCYRDSEWIEWHPTNADASRTHLNRELISGKLSRDERITKRIKDAGIKTLRKDQIRALTLIMSASCEDMQRIMNEGRFEAWCTSSIRWAQETHGEDNVVSAVLHMDEKTPHLHVTVVPIVQGISKDQAYRERKAKEAEEKGIEQKKKRKYKKKDPSTNRLCAADVMARTKLKEYQTTYAASVHEYGLTRGIDGSLAKHVDINDWYKTLVTEGQALEQELNQKKAEISHLNGQIAALYALSLIHI
jgi:hypothetical protein